MKKQKFISKKWFIILLIVLLLIPAVAYAAPASPLSQAAGIFEEVFKGLAAFLTTMYRFLQKLLWPIMLGIGGLMGNDLLFGAGMEERLLDVWYQVRNFVNIAFVIILLGVAFANVVGSSNDKFDLKKVIPRIIIALILVNFSYMGMKLILDATNVMTVAIFSLPSSISEDLKSTEIVTKDASGKLVVPENQKGLEEKICKSMFGDVKTFNDYTTKAKLTAAQKKSLRCEVVSTKLAFTETGKEFFAQYSPRNASLIMAIQLMNIVEIDKVTEAASAGFNLQKLSFTLLFSAVFYLLYAIAYVVLFIVLLVRVIVLWIIIALSPLIAVSIAIPEALGKIGGSSELGDPKEQFIKHAIVPIKIGVFMTLGYMMLDALKNVQSGQISNFFRLASFEVNTSGISDLQTMIIAFGAVAVVWMGVWAAAEDTMARGIVSWMKQGLSSAGQMFTKTLRLLPIIPAGPGKPGRSLVQTVDLWKEPLRQLQAKYGIQSSLTQNRPKLTYSEANRIQTVVDARKALGKDLSDKKAQQALATKLQGWRGVRGAKEDLYNKAFRAAGGTPAGWAKFRGGRLTSQQQAELNKLGVAPPVTTPPRTAGGTGTTGAGAGTTAAGTTAGVTAANIDSDQFDSVLKTASDYGSTVPNSLTQKIKDYKKAKGNKKKKLEKEIRGDQNFKNYVGLRNSAAVKPISDQGTVMARGAEADITPKMKTDFENAIKAAEADLKAKGVRDADVKPMLKGLVTKIFGSKASTHVPDKVKQLIGM